MGSVPSRCIGSWYLGMLLIFNVLILNPATLLNVFINWGRTLVGSLWSFTHHLQRRIFWLPPLPIISFYLISLILLVCPRCPVWYLIRTEEENNFVFFLILMKMFQVFPLAWYWLWASCILPVQYWVMCFISLDSPGILWRCDVRFLS